MKKKLTAALVAIASLCVASAGDVANAANWISIGGNTATGASTHMDVSSVAKHPQGIKFWLKTEYVDPIESKACPPLLYQSRRNLWVVNCEMRTIGPLMEFDYLGGHSVCSWSSPTKTADMNELVPESIGEAALNLVCQHPRKKAIATPKTKSF